jgi:hypothetical protein
MVAFEDASVLREILREMNFEVEEDPRILWINHCLHITEFSRTESVSEDCRIQSCLKSRIRLKTERHPM